MEFIKTLLYGVALVTGSIIAFEYLMIGDLFFPGFRPFRTMRLAYKQRKSRAVLLNKKELTELLRRDGDTYGRKMHEFMLYGKSTDEPIYLRTWDWFIMGQRYAIKQRRDRRERIYRAEKDAAQKAGRRVRGLLDTPKD